MALLLRRLGAFALDYLVIAAWLIVVVGAGVLLRALTPDLAAALFADPVTGELTGFLLLTLPIGAYFAIAEARPRGATWGKRRLRLRVVTRDGVAPSMRRSILRTALKLLPWELSHALIWRYATPGSAPELILDAGLVLVWLLIAANVISALLDSGHRTIYDLLAGTRVTNAPSSRGNASGRP